MEDTHPSKSQKTEKEAESEREQQRKEPIGEIKDGATKRQTRGAEGSTRKGAIVEGQGGRSASDKGLGNGSAVGEQQRCTGGKEHEKTVEKEVVSKVSEDAAEMKGNDEGSKSERDKLKSKSKGDKGKAPTDHDLPEEGSKSEGDADKNPEDEDLREEEAWDCELANVENIKPLYNTSTLPTSRDEAGRVFAPCSKGSLSFPIVLARNISKRAFYKWLQTYEVALYKAVHIEETGTVFLPEDCCTDHNTLRSVFGDGTEFPLVALIGGTHTSGGGSDGGLNLGSGWRLRDTESFPVLIEVGCKQSLPFLRERAWRLMADDSKPGNRLILVLKRYRHAQRLYLEAWQYNEQMALGDIPPDFSEAKNADPAAGIVGLPPAMTHFGSAHVSNGAPPPRLLNWQENYGQTHLLFRLRFWVVEPQLLRLISHTSLRCATSLGLKGHLMSSIKHVVYNLKMNISKNRKYAKEEN